MEISVTAVVLLFAQLKTKENRESLHCTDANDSNIYDK